MFNRLLLPVAACLLSFSAAASPPALPDQYGATGSLADFSGQPVLAIVVSVRKLRHIKRWEEGLRATYPELVSIRIADVAEDPQPAESDVAEKLRKRAPEGVSIYIDMNNAWAAEYELDTDEPCLLLFDADHNVIARFRGRANKERLAEVLAEMQSELDEATTTS